MKHIKSSCVIMFNRVLRLLERSLPVPVLLVVCIPLAWFFAVFCFSRKNTVRGRAGGYLNKFLLVFSKRLAEEKWTKRCDVHLSEACSEDLAAGTPMMLLFVHLGRFKLLPYWLRVIGIRASVIIKSKGSRRKAHRLWRDRGDLFPEQKIVWGRDELKGFIKQLDLGGALLMAVDTDLGKLETVTLKGGREVTIASGPFRLAQKHNCVVFPCGLVSRGNWKFRLRIGDRYTGDKSNLIEELLDCFDSGNSDERIPEYWR